VKKKTILFVGHCYYNNYYLAKELKKIGWRADTLNIDLNPSTQMYYHGEDYSVAKRTPLGLIKNLFFFIIALYRYNIFHFANAEGMYFPPFNQIPGFYKVFGNYSELRILKMLGKTIFHTTNGCRDAVTQTSFNKWGPSKVCDVCAWKNQPNVCSDQKNSIWGTHRNHYADYIGLIGGNRVDYNITPKAHEAPWMFSLDKDVWDPTMLIPANYLLPLRTETIKIYHAVGNYDTRSHGAKKQTIKSTEIWIDIINKLKSDGFDIELIFFKDVPNKQVKYYQAQADIFVDMLSFGFYGANVREAMMLGKPAICFLRPEWLESMAKELPEYVSQLPVISATPETAYEALKELVVNKAKREKIGSDMRDFGLKWHASDASAIRADEIYKGYLKWN
jgi:hypothetical protein